MKQTASILLLTLLAFNWVGYRMLSGFMEHKADLAFEKRIDNSDYNESNLIEIRVPLNAPYLTENSTEYERVEGELEIQGRVYKYVKRKVENGDLVLQCLPSETKTRLKNSRVDFFKLVNDLNHSAQHSNKNTSSFKSFTPEYKQENNCWIIPVISSIQPYSSIVDVLLIAEGFNSIPKQPPKA